MSFSQIIAAVEFELVAIFAWITVIKIGDEFVEETGAPPRIVVIPSEDTFGPPIGPGGNPRPIRNVQVAAEVVLWGDTRENTEGLRDQFVIALHRAIKGTDTSAHKRGGSYTLGKGKWTRKTNLMRAGFEYRFSFSVDVPILDRAWASTPNAPPAPATYVGPQALSNPVAPSTVLDPLHAIADVAAELGSPATPQGNVSITVPKP